MPTPLGNFHLYRKERKTTTHSKNGGVLLTVNNSLNHMGENLVYECEDDIVSCLVEDILVFCIYNPPASSAYRWSITKWEYLMEFIRHHPSRNVIIFGDANLVTVNWSTYDSTENYEKSVLNVLFENNFQQLVDFPTTTLHTLDVVLVDSDFILNVEPATDFTNAYSVNEKAASDHIAVKLAVSYAPSQDIAVDERPQQFSHCRGDFDLLAALIADKPFQGICLTNLNFLLIQWYEWLHEHISKSVPVRTQHRSSLPSWVSQATSYKLKVLNTLEERLNQNHSDKLQCRICVLQSSVDNDLKNDQSLYEQELASSRSTTKLFKYFKSVRKTKNCLPPVLHWNNIEANNPTSICNKFNQFFQSVFSKDVARVRNMCGPELLIDFDVSEHKIMTITTRLDVSKSRGHDNLPPALFKKTPSLCTSLSHICSSIKRTGCFPSQWKIGKLKPLHKQADKRMANNYRPITLLDIASKILERCIFDELYPFIRPLIPNSQYGFLKHNSTIIQLICYLDEIYRETDNRNTVKAVYIDFA